MTLSTRFGRRAAACLWALVVLSLLGVVSATIAWNWLAARRTLSARHHALQTTWLARAGGELSAVRILADGDGYIGETVSPIPDSQVKIEVRKEPDRSGVYRILCLATYPVGDSRAVTKAMVWTATLSADPAAVRLEVVPE